MIDTKCEPVFHYAELPGEGEAAWRAYHGRVLRAMIHRMNNHATVARGFSSLLLANPALDTRARDNLRRIQEAADGLAELATQALVVAGCAGYELMEFSPTALIQEIAATARELADGFGVGMSVAVATELPPVLVEPGVLREILLAVLAHAMGRASVAAAPEVILEASAAAGKCWVDVRVTDNGPAIAAENLAVVFEPFLVLENGAGCSGLAAAAMSAHLMRGSLGLKSGESGTTRRLRLPVAVAGGGA